MKPGQRDYRDVLDPGHRRRVMLYRALGACVLAAVLMIGLTLLDGRDSEPESRKDVLEQPVVTPVQLAATDEAKDESTVDELSVESEEALESSDGTHDTPDSPDAAESHPAPEPAVEVVSPSSPTPVTQPAPAQPVAAAAAAPRPAQQVRPRADSPARTVAPARAPEASAVSSHMVQVGDFGDPESRVVLRDAILQKGQTVSLQWRVAVGPFPDRAAANATQRRLDRDRKLKGLVVAQGGSQFVVQMGVFADVSNAETLQRRLQGWGYRVQSDARLMVGPFADRQEAETAAGEITTALGETTRITPASVR